MKDLICYYNGEYMKESEVRIGIWDHSFLYGGVFETSRTYNHVPFYWMEHIDRLFRSCQGAHIDPKLTPEDVYNISLKLFELNKNNLESEDDFLLVHRITRGAHPNITVTPPFPTILVNNKYMNPLYEKMVRFYREGIHLVVARTRQLPPVCLDPKIKHSNRLCNLNADYEAKMVNPDAFALMLDINGFAAECPTQNVFMVKDGKLLTPRTINCLQGMTRGVILELAKELKIECAETDLCVYDLYNADELFITATSFTIYGVAKFNEKLMRKPIPGPITERLFSAFSEKVGINLKDRPASYIRSRTNNTKPTLRSN